jgi:hypothetical protein
VFGGVGGRGLDWELDEELVFEELEGLGLFFFTTLSGRTGEV